MFDAANKWRARAEALVGTAAVFIIGFAPPVITFLFGLASLTNEENAKEFPAWGWFSICLATAAPAVWLARFIPRPLYMCHPELKKLDATMSQNQPFLVTPFDSNEPTEKINLPMAVVAGINLPRIPILLAIPVAVWWLAHAGAGVFVGLRMGDYIDSAFRYSPSWVKLILPHAFNFGFSFAANIYLMLAVALFVRRTTVLMRLWHIRLLIDLVLTAVTAVPAVIEWMGKTGQ